MKAHLNKENVIQEIVKAFSESEFPGNDNLISNLYEEEPNLIRIHFKGQSNWNILTPKFLDIDGALSFLSDEGFRFYIPAFMIADINEELEINNPTIRLCGSLTTQSESRKIAKVWGGGTLGDRARDCFKFFSINQVKAIVLYLQWKLDQEDDNCIKESLENYWLKRIKNII